MGWTIISGGQTGVDRAALDAARALGLDYGGFVPRGRRTEDGAAGRRLCGHDRDGERPIMRRGRRNILAADATLILTRGEPDGGTRLTLETARAKGKPVLLVDLAETATDEASAPDPGMAARHAGRDAQCRRPARKPAARHPRRSAAAACSRQRCSDAL